MGDKTSYRRMNPKVKDPLAMELADPLADVETRHTRRVLPRKKIRRYDEEDDEFN